ncbi:hypothetical protein ND2E_2036 [Colwellia psychrerythraea]|uniref:Uncharacterized protein n=1 Tax=Colwellia psychrerythraea TaxID=28229 RepID=A0A099KWV8_COLPS|nr:hypothetical protein ND2E_2036 [Colwellia psychrerythraea]
MKHNNNPAINVLKHRVKSLHLAGFFLNNILNDSPGALLTALLLDKP